MKHSIAKGKKTENSINQVMCFESTVLKNIYMQNPANMTLRRMVLIKHSKQNN